uniref:Uncharacterized protein n=1 Tax=Nelumbo nucifera TaxID=4432 RepID=A0A822YEN1_NELNU|nr:TPA_asm: hypothetical protein HUJ06_030883 [Nelumbo nucifera]
MEKYKMDRTEIPEGYGPWLRADVDNQNDRFLNAGRCAKLQRNAGNENTHSKIQKTDPKATVSNKKARDEPQSPEVSILNNNDEEEQQGRLELIIRKTTVKRRLFEEEPQGTSNPASPGGFN